MRLGIKCAAVKRGKEVECNGIDLDVGRVIQSADEGYKYLAILEKGEMCQQKMKENVKKEYLKHVKPIPKSKLDTRNTFQVINTWTVPAIHYGTSIIEWVKEELEYTDRKAKTLIIMYRGLHTRSNVQRLYIPRSEGRRGLISVKDCVDENQFCKQQVRTSAEGLTRYLKLLKSYKICWKTIREKQKWC